MARKDQIRPWNPEEKISGEWKKGESQNIECLQTRDLEDRMIQREEESTIRLLERGKGGV